MALLAGDIGGTKTHLALFEGAKLLFEKKFASKEYASFAEIVKEFLAAHPAKVEKACFGIAGPIIEERCETTNLPWVIEAKALREDLGTKKVLLINDLVANAFGLRCLKKEEFVELNAGNPNNIGNQALIAAGTGLGQAGLYWDGKEHHPFSSEGGHTDFAPRDELEMEFLRYLQLRYDHASYERVLSGSGLYELYHFLIDMSLEKASPAVHEEFSQKKPEKVITEMALKNADKACVRALTWFVSLYGAEAGNLALKFLALGGLYIGGGIAPQILPYIQKKSFMEAFTAKGRFAPLLSSIPVRVILNPDAALLGAAYCAEHKL